MAYRNVDYRYCCDCGTGMKHRFHQRCNSCYRTRTQTQKYTKRQVDRYEQEKQTALEKSTCHICQHRTNDDIPEDATSVQLCSEHRMTYTLTKKCQCCHLPKRSIISKYSKDTCLMCSTGLLVAKRNAITHSYDKFATISNEQKKCVVPGVYMEIQYPNGYIVQTHFPRFLIKYVGHTNQIICEEISGGTALYNLYEIIDNFRIYRNDDTDDTDDDNYKNIIIRVIQGYPGRIPFEKLTTL